MIRFIIIFSFVRLVGKFHSDRNCIVRKNLLIYVPNNDTLFVHSLIVQESIYDRVVSLPNLHSRSAGEKKGGA